EMDTVAIVTAPASRDLAALHHRVPVTIGPDEFERWLDGRAFDADEVMGLLTGPAEGEFAWHEISTRVNRVANDDAQLLLPISDEEREAEAPKPKKPARKTASSASEDEGQGSLF
ncbi:MAG: SOS response-associated peptidase family protein, partial [Bradyrhizobium sp.]